MVEVAEALYEKHLIKSPLAFKFYVQLMGRTNDIQSGEFKIFPSLSIPEIVDVISKGPQELWVTIPEGLRREQIIERFITVLEMPGDRTSLFREEFLEESEGKEGFLFPDTYLFPRDVKVDTVISAMRNTFDKRLSEIGGDGSSKLSLGESVVLASIIERETKADVERPVVAGILLNRLDTKMGLQADATVQYAIASAKCKTRLRQGSSEAQCVWWPILVRDDLQIDSPYNTYKYRGLPPTPIANPGLAALRAAIYPEESDYFYYIHDPEGNIHYAKTLEEHNENVRQYLGK